MIRRLVPTTAFARATKRLAKRSPIAAAAVRATLDRLAADAFDPGLQTHKLHSDLAGLWACWAGYDLRVVFEFVTDSDTEAVLLLGVGTHDEMY